MRSTSPSSAIGTCLAGLGYLLVAGLFLAVAVYPVATDPLAPSVGDLLTLYYPHMRYGFAALARGELPLWNPYQACGTPFLADPSIGFFYPLYAPFLFLDTARALDVDLALHLALAGLSMFLLCRHFGLAWPASLLAGLIYAYQGSALIQVNYPSFLVASAWIPLLFLLVDGVLQAPTRRAVALLAAGAGVLGLGAYPQHLYFAALALLPFLVVRAALVAGDVGWAALARRLALLGLGGALGLGIALVRILPAVEYMRQSWRPPGGLSLTLAGMMAIAPDVFLRGLVAMPRRGPAFLLDDLRKAHVGILPLALALLGLVFGRRRAATLPLAAAGIGAAVYAFGTAGPLYPLLFQMPGGNWFRGPSRALSVFGLAVAFLAGAGLDWLLRRLAPAGVGTRRRLAVGAAVVILGGAIVADLFAAQSLTGARPARLPGYGARNAALLDAVRSRQGFDRTYVWMTLATNQRLYFYSDLAKAGVTHGLWSCTDYSVSGERWERYMAGISEPVFFPIGYRVVDLNRANAPLLSLAGIRYFVFEGGLPRFADPALVGSWREVARDGDVVAVENPDALPRAFVVPRAVVEPDADRLLARLREADLRREAFVEVESPVLPTAAADAAPGTARIVSYEPNRVVLESDTATPGLLVLSDQYAPGWRATVDGASAPVLRADYLFRGIPVPAGRHRVELVYRPPSFAVGAAGTLLSLAVVALLLLVPARARR